MKNTKWLFLIVCIFGIFLTDLYAQKPVEKSTDERGELTVVRYNKDISLTPQQKVMILSLAKSTAQKCDSINKLDSVNVRERVNQKKVEYNKLKVNVEALLTENQKILLKSKQLERDLVMKSKSNK